MFKKRRALVNLPKNSFEKNLLAVFNNVKRGSLAKENNYSKRRF